MLVGHEDVSRNDWVLPRAQILEKSQKTLKSPVLLQKNLA